MTGEREMSLAGWLTQRRQAAETGGTLVLGGTGHLILSGFEEEQAAAHLRGRVLPEIARQAGDGGVILVTGAAPGADRVFAATARDWCERAGLRCRYAALLPVPPEWLIEDWVLRLEAVGQRVSREMRQAGEAELQRCLEQAQWQVPLYAPTELAQLASPAWRADQYRKLAACLAEQSDVLIAVLRSQNLREAGGTAEVVEWRRHLRRIPPRLSTLPPEEARTAAERNPLIVIDPSIAYAPAAEAPAPVRKAAGAEEQAVLARAEDAMRSGNDLLCHDILYRAFKRGLRSRRMEYLRILSLANAGSTNLALERYRGLNLAPAELDEDWLALQGRLEKDLALSGAPGARRHFTHAAEAYLAAYRRWKGSYSGINAATMHLMAEQPAVARALALEVSAQLQQQPLPAGEVEQYFLHATAAEAALLLGDLQRFEESLRAANEVLVDDVVRRGRTLRQLRRICEKRKADCSALAVLEMPPVILLQRDDLPCSGDGSTRVQLTSDLPPSALVFAGLADACDLLQAEELLDRGARLYPTLPCQAAELQRQWRTQWGEAAAERLGRVLDRCDRVAVLPGFLDEESAWRRGHLHATSLGASLMTARRLGCVWRLMHVEPRDGALHYRLGGEVAQVGDSWDLALTLAQFDREAQLQSPVVAGREMVGILFADFAGFRRILDRDMPRFWHEVMGAMSSMLAKYAGRVLFQSTWGDALHVVTRDATAAAEIAADIQQFTELRRLKRDGTLGDLELRVAAHYAPAFRGMDPIRGAPIYYGSQLSFTARIEPVTPPGTVFGSEAFVARLILESPQRFALDYAGEIELAKNFGTHRLFAIHRRA